MKTSDPWYQANQEKIRDYSRRSYMKYRDEINARKRERRQADAEQAKKEREYSQRWRERNRERVAAYQKRYAQEHREDINGRRRAHWDAAKQRGWKLKQLYGISLADYESMLQRQGDVCAICGGPPNGRGATHGYYAVDHDETSGRIRGLLCSKCNIGIGQLAHDPERLRSALRYLTEGGKMETPPQEPEPQPEPAPPEPAQPQG